MPVTSFLNVNYDQTTTPLFHQKCHAPSRKLWEKKSIDRGDYRENWSHYRNKESETWDEIESPQFIDFNDIPKTGDSFFDRPIVISTPLPGFGLQKIPAPTEADEIINSFNNVGISDAKNENLWATEKEKDVVIHFTGNNCLEKKYTIHTVNQKSSIPNECNNNMIGKPQCAAKPFSFTFKHNYEQRHFVKEENKPKLFKANPLPKFIKSRVMPASKSKDGGKEIKEQKTGDTEKYAKKNIEIWKRKPMKPEPCKIIRERPKTPPLSTAIRAKERKRFDDALKEKEKERERKRQQEEIEKKKQEEEELALLRKQTIHKAQPIRRYKKGLPEVQKRPLTDPISPKVLKRRRYA